MICLVHAHEYVGMHLRAHALREQIEQQVSSMIAMHLIAPGKIY